MSKECKAFLAIDLGAGSGRGIVGRLNQGRLTLEQVHRFPNEPVQVGSSLYWDMLRLYHEIKLAIKAAYQCDNHLAGIGIDTWGVDFGLLASDGSLLANPYHYRDNRTAGMMDMAFDLIPRKKIFSLTGIQCMQFNTLYQLLAMARKQPQVLGIADRLLLMGELFTYLLTGEAVAEFTNATTTQLVNPITGTWSNELLTGLGIPSSLFPPIVAPGMYVGPLRADVAAEIGTNRLPVFLPAVHDTASAIAAVPLANDSSCFISSGTWSLMGVELEQPLINEESCLANMTNEGGVDGRFCFLKNIMGMWLLQECRRAWEHEGDPLDYHELQMQAEQAAPAVTFIHPDSPEFFFPGRMPERIKEYAYRTGQPIPAHRGAIVRCILESLALRYYQVLLQLEHLTGRHIHTIHIVGGGAQNSLLNQLTADATGCTVIAGPVEATAIGNILVQAIAAGQLSGIAEGRTVVRDSFAPRVFVPKNNQCWGEAYERFTALPQVS